MSNVLDDVTDETVDATHIRLRVDDWEKRLKDLYSLVSEWLPEGWTVRQGTPVLMREKLMRKFGIVARQLLTLRCVSQEGVVATLAPHALWIIGENGRVDLRLGERHYLITDFADNFETPNWQAAPADQRSNCQLISRAFFHDGPPDYRQPLRRDRQCPGAFARQRACRGRGRRTRPLPTRAKCSSV